MDNGITDYRKPKDQLLGLPLVEMPLELDPQVEENLLEDLLRENPQEEGQALVTVKLKNL